MEPPAYLAWPVFVLIIASVATVISSESGTGGAGTINSSKEWDKRMNDAGEG